MSKRTVILSLLAVSLALTLSAVGFLREAEGYVSKHYGVADQFAYAKHSRIASWLFWSALACWVVSVAFTFQLAAAEKLRLQYFAAALPICGVLALFAALFLFPVHYV